jgi:hypothetical protein
MFPAVSPGSGGRSAGTTDGRLEAVACAPAHKSASTPAGVVTTARRFLRSAGGAQGRRSWAKLVPTVAESCERWRFSVAGKSTRPAMVARDVRLIVASEGATSGEDGARSSTNAPSRGRPSMPTTALSLMQSRAVWGSDDCDRPQRRAFRALQVGLRQRRSARPAKNARASRVGGPASATRWVAVSRLPGSTPRSSTRNACSRSTSSSRSSHPWSGSPSSTRNSTSSQRWRSPPLRRQVGLSRSRRPRRCARRPARAPRSATDGRDPARLAA